MGSKIESLDLRRIEKRKLTSIEVPGSDLWSVFGINDVTLPTVTIDSALTVPPVTAAATFLPRSLASLPLHAYRNKGGEPERIKGGLETLIHEAPNAEWTAFKLRQYFWTQVFTGGRGLLWIERAGSNITGLYPMNPTMVSIRRDAMGRTTYEIRGEGKIYQASEVIDVPFMLKADGLSHYSPVMLGAKAIQLSLAMNEYAATFFAAGGVPPLALVGPTPANAEAMRRALADVKRAIDEARSASMPLINLPPGYELKPIGFDPEKGQMTDARRFQTEEIARIYGLPPVFLQDLTRGTFSNTEQQDLHLVKHLISQWVEAFEQEMNLKLFGQRNGGRYVEHNLDGLLRGDFLTRMQAHAQSVQNAVRTPNEVRALENLPPLPGGDDLLIQGATVPLGSQPNTPGNEGDLTNEA